MDAEHHPSRSNTEYCFVGNLESWDNNLRFSHKKDPLDWTHQKVMNSNALIKEK